MAYLISGGNPPGSAFRTFVVRYTAVGGEETAAISLPSTMADTSYAVACASAGGSQAGGVTSGIQVPDIPVADRTTTGFEALFGSPLVTGDLYDFTISGNVSL